MRNLTVFVLLLAGCAQFDRFEAGPDDQQIAPRDVARLADATIEAGAETGVDASRGDDVPEDAAPEAAGDAVAPVDASDDAAVDTVPADVLTPLQRCEASCYRTNYRCITSDGGAVACCWHPAISCGSSGVCASAGWSCGGPSGGWSGEECCRVY